MKALLFSNLFPSSAEPTRGVFNLQRFGALARYCEVRIVAPVPWWSRVRRPRDLLFAPEETRGGIQTVYPTYWSLPGQTPLHARAMRLSLARRIRAIRREFPFDVILAAWAYPDGVAAAHLAAELGCPLVTMVLGSDINELAQDAGLRKQIVWALDRSQHIVAVSESLRDRVIELGIPVERIVVQHNGVDGERFMPQDKCVARRSLGLPADRRIVCYAGNFKPEKGVDILVEALSRLQRCMKDCLLVMVGSGPLETSLRERAQALGLEDRIWFAGRQPHESIPSWIASCDVFCLPSRREGCPNVVLEALACGRPVVASAVGGVPELITGDNGVTAPPNDVEALAEALRRGLDRPWDAASLRRSVHCLSWDQFGHTLNDVLAGAIDAWSKQPGQRRWALQGRA